MHGNHSVAAFYSSHQEVSFRAFQSHVTYQEIQLSLQKSLLNELIVCYNLGACSVAISNLKKFLLIHLFLI